MVAALVEEVVVVEALVEVVVVEALVEVTRVVLLALDETALLLLPPPLGAPLQEKTAGPGMT